MRITISKNANPELVDVVMKKQEQKKVNIVATATKEQEKELEKLWIEWYSGTNIKGQVPKIREAEKNIPKNKRQEISSKAYQIVFGFVSD